LWEFQLFYNLGAELGENDELIRGQKVKGHSEIKRGPKDTKGISKTMHSNIPVIRRPFRLTVEICSIYPD